CVRSFASSRDTRGRAQPSYYHYMPTAGAYAAHTQHMVNTTSATTATPQRRYMLVPSVTMPMAALTDSVVSSDVDSSSGSATEPTAERSTPVSTAPPRAPEWPQEPGPP